MKLQVQPARAGLRWMAQGARTFFRHPLAMAGLFFMFLTLVSVLGMVPGVGMPLALVVLPAATLGLMAASREITLGRFPMPLILFTGVRGNPAKRQAMLLLGVVQALGFALGLGASYLADGGQFVGLYLGKGAGMVESLNTPEPLVGMAMFLTVNLPMSMLLWHAPALVHWHDLGVGKSLFFSMVACWKNKWALSVFALGWMALMLAVGFSLMALGALLGAPGLAGGVMMPALLCVACMFFSSLYFTFQESFVPPDTAA
jgi:hypothetical protein